MTAHDPGSADADDYDASYDVIVVGSGAGGMTAALGAHGHKFSSLVLEKADRFGGTSAVSGGGIWVPCNAQIQRLGGSDSYDDALLYMKALTGGEVPLPQIESYLQNAPKMVMHMAERFDVRFRAVKRYPDYFPQVPGARPGYRTMEPVEFDAAQLGAAFDEQREAYRGTQLMGRISMNQVEAHTLFTRGPGWIWLMLRMLARYWFDFGWRRKTKRDRRQTLGQALTGRLRKAMLDANIPLWLNCGLESLIQVGGRVTGVEISRNGQRQRLEARRAVVLACGGFESNQEMREQYLPKPTQAGWTAAPPINHGEGIRAGQALGAATAFMDLTWGTPTVVVPGASSQPGLFVERALPGCVLVNRRGERFFNEAAPYTELVYAIYKDHARTGESVPCWLVFDATFRKKYPMGPMLPGSLQPDSKLPKKWLDTVYYRADTLDALAAQIGVDARGLAKSVADIGRFAASGKDEQFGRGDNIFDRYYSDPSVKPNPCLGPIERAPFYGVPVVPGELGTKGGLVTDANGAVLREDGSRIDGLYAVGNCSASVMGRTYAGPGSTLGPAMTFGYLAAWDIARRSASAAGARGATAAV